MGMLASIILNSLCLLIITQLFSFPIYWGRVIMLGQYRRAIVEVITITDFVFGWKSLYAVSLPYRGNFNMIILRLLPYLSKFTH